MLDLNVWRSQLWSRTCSNALSLGKALFGSSLLLVLFTNILLLVAANVYGADLNVNLVDAATNQRLGNTQVTAYRVEADGSRSWYSRNTTDETGQAVFTLENLESGTSYVLRTKVYNQFKSYSSVLPNTPSFDFVVGKVRVALKNGSEDGLPPLANAEVSIKRLEADGDYDWYGSATTDELGMLRLNLPDISNGQAYRISAKSTVNQQRKYSDLLSSEGDFTFVVGNKALVVNLKDAASGNPIGEQQVTVYQLDEQDKKQWLTNGDSDANGEVLFDLDGLGKGESYVLRAKVYNGFKVYSGVISEPGVVDLTVGSTRVSVLNGTQASHPPMVEQRVYIYQVKDDDEKEYFASAYTDDVGFIKVDLPDVDNGQAYMLASKSPISGQKKYSEALTRSGDHSFVVGNKPLAVTLVDGVSQAPIANQRIDVYDFDEQGDKHWHTRADTDEQGKVSFDLARLGSGQAYLLRTKAFNNYSSYSNLIETANDYLFKVGTTVVNVTNGTVNSSQPLPDHKVYFYEVLADGEKDYFASVYSDDNGVVRVDLPDLNKGKNYLAKAKSPTDERTFYEQAVAVSGVTQLVVGSMPLTVKLVDALSGQVISDKSITAYEILANGDKDWFTKKTTDASGIAVFDLPQLGQDRHYKLGVRGFDDFKTYTDVLSAPGELTFSVGSVAVNLKNGTVASQPALANHPMSISRLEGDKHVWVGSATSDDNGIVRLDLPGIEQGIVYRFRSKSPVNETNKYSPPITKAGNIDFVVGNPGVELTLSNILTGALYPQERVTAYRLDEAGERQWYGRLDTDESGTVTFDLDGINQGQTYIFRASLFESGSSYSQIVTTSGHVDFAIGAVPVTLIDKDNERVLPGVKVTAYHIEDAGKLKWIKSGHTSDEGLLTFDLPGLSEGRRFVFKAHNPFGENHRYYGPVITSIGALNFNVKEGEFGELDLSAPSITIETPAHDIANAAGFSVSGVATDDQAVEHVEMTVVDPVVGSHSVVASLDEASGRWQADIQAEWVTVGQSATITAKAYDYALNNASANRSYLITEDIAPPVIQITSHQNQDSVNVVGFTVLGTVTDDIGVASITATVTDPLLGETVTNQALNISSLSGQWAFPVTNGKLSPDQLVTISLLATDFNGKTTEHSLQLKSLQISTNPMQLVQRITFGLTPQLLSRLKLGDDILQEQLNPDSIDDSVFEAQMEESVIIEHADLRHYLITYMTHSKKQLREVMAWFWENHFNTNINTHGSVEYELSENRLFRQHALGRFRDLLESSAKSPAMIYYLNNAQNVAGRANENYSREVMELHTMGVDGGYTADDIAALSRIFTGWNESDGAFFFESDLHDDGDKIFLGQTINGGGVAEGEQALDILSRHQSTANFICSKLVTLFVSDQSVSQLQSQCAAEFLASEGDISAVLRVIFGSQQFAAPEHYRNKVKTPLELMVSTARAFNGQILASGLDDELRVMGMHLFEYPAPTGLSEVAEDWINSNALLQRIRLVNQAAWQDSEAVDIDFGQLLLEQGYSSAEAIVSFLFELALSNDFTGLEYQIALSILNEQSAFDINDNDADDKLKRLLGTVLSFPSYQYQ